MECGKSGSASKTEACCLECEKNVSLLSTRLQCETCRRLVHLTCLSGAGSFPSPLVGDTFFVLHCRRCSPSGTDFIKRDKINWLTALVVAIYNLKHQSPELARNGYYHWKVHVASFLDSNWDRLFGPQIKKRKTWLGTVSGTMSHWSGAIFLSGLAVLKESGWWKLVNDLAPADLIASVPSSIHRHSISAANITSLSSRRSCDDSLLQSAAANTVTMTQRTRGVQNSIATAIALKARRSAIFSDAKEPKKSTSATSTSQPKSRKRKRGAAEDTWTVSSDVVEGNAKPKKKDWFTDVPRSPKGGLPLALFNDDQSPPSSTNILSSEELHDLRRDFGGSPFPSTTVVGVMDDMISASRDSLPNVEELVSVLPDGYPRSPPSSQASSIESYENDKSSIDLEKSDKENTKISEDATARQSKSSSRAARKKIPLSFEDEDEIRRMLEEKSLYAIDPKRGDDALNLLKKLQSRRIKRANGKKLRLLDKNDVEKVISDLISIKKEETEEEERSTYDALPEQQKKERGKILDRYQLAEPSGSTCEGNRFKGCTFRTRLLGRDLYDLQPIKSPFTGRLLKPFIRRDYKSEPLKLKLLRQIVQRANPPGTGCSFKRYPIDYLYVRPNHIPTINQLAREFFWPGIDLSESLKFPDFSCVAVYKKMVVGFAFLVPDVTYLEAYVSFIFTHPDWRRVGIAKFMLYHLIQTCMGKDITLHASPTNPAILLYQKFGFKVEEYITNFYDKYLPDDSKECKHALFLRLSR